MVGCSGAQATEMSLESNDNTEHCLYYQLKLIIFIKFISDACLQTLHYTGNAHY